jgi:cytochrome c oxidase subunit I
MGIRPEPNQSREPGESPSGFWGKYIFSRDHKVVGRLYFFLALFSVLVGIVLSVLMRLHVAWPQVPVPLLGNLSPLGAPGGVILPEYYLSLMTLHGTLMIFFVLTTAPQGGFGNFFLPLHLGAREMAFPRLNMLSFWITCAALATLLSTFVVSGGPPTSGWTAYPPLSALGAAAAPGEGLGQNLWAISIALFCVGAMLSSVNFIVTTIELRARGMHLLRMPLPCWGWFVTAVVSLLSFAVLFGACLLLILDRVGGTSFFIPGGLNLNGRLVPGHSGGSPLLWQHLFWFFGHPEVYIAIMPGMGIVSHVLSTFARKPVFGYRAMAYSLVAIGVLSFSVWGHHMFVSGMSPYAGFAFSVMTMAIGVPSAIKTFNWLGTIWQGRLRLTTAMLWALAFVSVFVTGGLSGLILAQPPLDTYFNNTYFVVAHFHLIMGAGVVFSILAGTYFWFPKMFGRMLNERLGKLHFWLTFLGVHAIFVPMHFLGIEGNPRRYSEMTDNFLQPLMGIHRFISIAVLVTGAAQLIFFFNLFWSMFTGKKAEDNPWEGTSLEWTVASPPPPGNFGDRQPEVYHDPYEYSVPGAARDFVMQDSTEVIPAGA